MRLEYTEEQEKELRMTELEAVLENDLYDSNVEKYCLEVELQFLQRMYLEILPHLLMRIISLLRLYMRKKARTIRLHYTIRTGNRDYHILVIRICISLWRKLSLPA